MPKISSLSPGYYQWNNLPCGTNQGTIDQTFENFSQKMLVEACRARTYQDNKSISGTAAL
jgi:hypothetical protein